MQLAVSKFLWIIGYLRALSLTLMHMRLLHPIALTWDSEKAVICILFSLCWHQFLSCEAIMKLCEIKLSGVNMFDFLCFERIVSLNVQRHVDFK